MNGKYSESSSIEKIIINYIYQTIISYTKHIHTYQTPRVNYVFPDSSAVKWKLIELLKKEKKKKRKGSW